jgi:nitric oxide reductase subunit C
MAGPSLAGISAKAEEVLASGKYKGEAKDVKGFIHESIMHPSAYLEPGDMYSAGGTSFMPDTYAKALTPEQVDQLVDYLSTLK